MQDDFFLKVVIQVMCGHAEVNFFPGIVGVGVRKWGNSDVGDYLADEEAN